MADDARRTTGTVILVGLVMLLAAAPATSRSAPPKVGDTAADFTLAALDGSKVQLSQLTKQGPVALIVLRGWPGYQCPICTKQVTEFFAASDQFKQHSARIVMVYPGPADQLKEHAEDFVEGKVLPEGFSFAIDPAYEFTNLYNLRWDAQGETAYPSTFVIDSVGVIRFARISKTHAGRASAAEVLAALKKLQQ